MKSRVKLSLRIAALIATGYFAANVGYFGGIKAGIAFYNEYNAITIKDETEAHRDWYNNTKKGLIYFLLQSAVSFPAFYGYGLRDKESKLGAKIS